MDEKDPLSNEDIPVTDENTSPQTNNEFTIQVNNDSANVAKQNIPNV